MHRLLALLAPGSIEAEVVALQQAVFAEHGFVSAIALPPLVPVRFLPADASLQLPQVPGREVTAGFVVAVATPDTYGRERCLVTLTAWVTHGRRVRLVLDGQEQNLDSSWSADRVLEPTGKPFPIAHRC